jgi:hypothetical protein
VNNSAIATLAQVLDRSEREGVFRPNVEPTGIHVLASAVCILTVSNQHSFGVLFGGGLVDPAVHACHKAMLMDAVLHVLTAAYGGKEAEAA